MNGITEKDVQKWVFPNRKPTKKQTRVIIALTLMATSKMILENHIYSFNGVLYKQLTGGPIGPDVATKSAKVVMFKFVREYINRLVKLSLYENIVLLKNYVDDLNQGGFCLPFGTSFES